jgi:hypothetical protein
MGACARVVACLLILALSCAQAVVHMPKGFCTGTESPTQCLNMFEQATLVMAKVGMSSLPTASPFFSFSPFCLFFFCLPLSSLTFPKLAYATTEDKFIKDKPHPMVALGRSLKLMREATDAFLKRTDIEWTPDLRATVEYAALVASTANVVDGSRDCVAVRYTSPDDRKERIAFAFRGTAISSDLYVDFLLGSNAGTIKRLDEARAFVRRVVRVHRIQGKDLGFFGHSLGGNSSFWFLA